MGASERRRLMINNCKASRSRCRRVHLWTTVAQLACGIRKGKLSRSPCQEFVLRVQLLSEPISLNDWVLYRWWSMIWHVLLISIPLRARLALISQLMS